MANGIRGSNKQKIYKKTREKVHNDFPPHPWRLAISLGRLLLRRLKALDAYWILLEMS